MLTHSPLHVYHNSYSQPPGGKGILKENKQTRRITYEQDSASPYDTRERGEMFDKARLPFYTQEYVIDEPPCSPYIITFLKHKRVKPKSKQL